MTKPNAKKQKISKNNSFDLHSSQFFLTYSKCDLNKEQVLEYLTKIINKKTNTKTYYISNYIIVNEQHEDGTPHKHVYLKLDKKIRIRKVSFFDIKTETTTLYHPNIQSVRSTKAVIDYILKHGDYISKYKIDNLKVAQKVIEREIKEGRYVTNNLIAKEYPSTYTIYGKRLIDWKTRIEEDYYKPPGKPFVEFHYGKKYCGKSTYVTNFNNKEAYILDDHWFDGYSGQRILIIDEFTGSQLLFSTFLKILSGQQQRLEVKGSKELNYINHVIITSNYEFNSLYQNLKYNQGQADWRIDAIWHYKKSNIGFSDRKCERNPYLKQQHRKYLKEIKYHNYFRENWDLDNNLNATKNIFHNNYISIPYNVELQGGEINDDDLPLEDIALQLVAKQEQENQNQIIVKRKRESESSSESDIQSEKNIDSDYESELSAIDSDDSQVTKELKQKNIKKGKQK
jgi:hypothetical protein